MFKYYIILVPIVALILIILNWLISINNKYLEKEGPFECGFTSYQQSRSTFSVAFILIAILFLPFDLEISFLLPYVISSYINGLYGLTIVVIFLLILTIAFIFEIQLNALKLKRRWLPKSNKLINKLYK
uniref:NADH-ubiquinone oxidoreductase chain 3 n=1 Tax=[Candida] alai TaxID=434040 RepID=E3VW18_9ASCO|nr:NADH dehydrogenase subunit 3 [[Candida] alai]ADO51041.1 NADH dehydrogenase subunit 3 [[Candida] alai]